MWKERCGLLGDEKAVEFRLFLLTCFENTVSEVLGEEVRKALVERLMKNTGLKREELIGRTDILTRNLKGVFGDSAVVLEGMMAKQIYSRLGLGTPPQNLETAIDQAKLAYVESYSKYSRT